jgi:putative SOS response-associated peptidase YedK
MCGRYSLICIDDLGKRFRIFNPTLGIRSHFNIAPSQMMPVIVRHEQVEMIMMQWGLIPHWVKDPKKSMHPINAKAETLAEKPMFRRNTENLEEDEDSVKKKGGANPIRARPIRIFT